MTPYVIGIAGDSGVGKTTIASIISFIYGKENVLQLSTDDLHLWPRNDVNWETITHLNPAANDLVLGDEHLKNLIENKPISRAVYNHKTGCHDAPVLMAPKRIIINEGLHSFYTDFARDKTNLKIFVDVEENLRVHWKILRDVKYRSSTIEKVLKSIELRKKDSADVREKHLAACDVIVKIDTEQPITDITDFREDPVIKTSFIFNNDKFKNSSVFSFIGEYYKSLHEYIELSKKVGVDEDLVIDKGGNLSIKVDDHLMIIKSSGHRMSDANYDNGYNVVDIAKLKLHEATNDTTLDAMIKHSSIHGSGVPSMETAFHSFIKGKYVLHTHPRFLNVLLCLQDPREMLEEALPKYKFGLIDYKTPGFEVMKSLFWEMDKIIFLKNHGLIVRSDSLEEIYDITRHISLLCRDYVLNRIDYSEFDIYEDVKEYYFPDAYVLKSNPKVKQVNNLIGWALRQIGCARSLTDEELKKLDSSEAEKRRK